MCHVMGDGPGASDLLESKAREDIGADLGMRNGIDVDPANVGESFAWIRGAIFQWRSHPASTRSGDLRIAVAHERSMNRA
jgi:hypothetical protein